jgi:diacylglycerol kinase family enzyme
MVPSDDTRPVTPSAQLKLPRARGVLFLNPTSGMKLPPDELAAFERAVAAANLELVRIGKGIDCAAAVREKLSDGKQLAIAAGGDGTINSVIQALVHTDAVLGVVPLGTYNHFAKDLGLPLPWREALEVAVGGAVRQVDAARVNDRFFVNNVSMGLYPELVRRREEKGRDYPRWKARLYAAYATLRKFPHVAVTLESDNHAEVVRTHILMVSNNTYDLSRIGIEAPRGTLEEGRLSVYWLPKVGRLELMRFVAHYLAGRVRETPGFRSFRTARVKMHSSKARLSIGIDGEVATLPPPLVITIVPQSLLVKVPRG